YNDFQVLARRTPGGDEDGRAGSFSWQLTLPARRMQSPPLQSSLMSDSFWRTLGRGLLQIIYPNSCWVCGQAIPPETHAFCPSCRAAVFTDPKPSCERCAATVGPYVNTADGCPRCRGESFAFDGAVRLGTYEGPLRDVI